MCSTIIIIVAHTVSTISPISILSCHHLHIRDNEDAVVLLVTDKTESRSNVSSITAIIVLTHFTNDLEWAASLLESCRLSTIAELYKVAITINVKSRSIASANFLDSKIGLVTVAVFHRTGNIKHDNGITFQLGHIAASNTESSIKCSDNCKVLNIQITISSINLIRKYKRLLDRNLVNKLVYKITLNPFVVNVLCENVIEITDKSEITETITLNHILPTVLASGDIDFPSISSFQLTIHVTINNATLGMNDIDKVIHVIALTLHLILHKIVLRKTRHIICKTTNHSMRTLATKHVNSCENLRHIIRTMTESLIEIALALKALTIQHSRNKLRNTTHTKLVSCKHGTLTSELSAILINYKIRKFDETSLLRVSILIETIVHLAREQEIHPILKYILLVILAALV